MGVWVIDFMKSQSRGVKVHEISFQLKFQPKRQLDYDLLTYTRAHASARRVGQAARSVHGRWWGRKVGKE